MTLMRLSEVGRIGSCALMSNSRSETMCSKCVHDRRSCAAFSRTPSWLAPSRSNVSASRSRDCVGFSNCSDTLVMKESRTWEKRMVSLTSEISTTTNFSLSLPTMTFSQFGRDTEAAGSSLRCPISACLAASRVAGLPALGADCATCAVVVVRSNCFLPPSLRTSRTALSTDSSTMASSRTTPSV